MYFDFLFLVSGKNKKFDCEFRGVSRERRKTIESSLHMADANQAKNKFIVRPSSPTYFFSLFVSLRHQSDNVMLLKTITAYK